MHGDKPVNRDTFWLTYFLTLSSGIMLAYLVAIVSPNMDVANAALPTYLVCHYEHF